MPKPEEDMHAAGATNGKALSLLQRLSQILRGAGSAQSIRESLEKVIEESERQSPALSQEERIMLANLLRFGELRVDDVKVPRGDIVGVDEKTHLKDLVVTFREAQHSRLPLYRDTLDDPSGLVHVKDVLSLMEVHADGSVSLPDVPVASIKREIIFVPPSMPALGLLLKMQASHIHLALVIDEYGGTDGLVSIENLVEEIVGDIGDEHDVDEAPHMRGLGNGAFEVDARMDLEDFKAKSGIDFAPAESSEQIETLGGLVVSLIGRVPQRGEIIHYHPGYEFEILEADPRRIKLLRLRPSYTHPSSPDQGVGQRH